MDLSKLITAGKEFGLSGEDLKTFVTEEQKKQRDERAELLELRRQEKETAEIQLAIARENQAKSEQKLSSDSCKARSPKLPPFHDDKDNIVTPTELKEAQQKDDTLQKLQELAESHTEKVSRHNNISSFYFKDGILYRSFHSTSMDPDTNLTQVVVPKPYRKQVMQTAHENLLGGHQGAKKTTDKILTNFFWPGMNSDITRYCRSCDVCQRTLAKGRVTKVPLGKMPLIEVPFERIAVDIVGPIHPMTDQKNRYILTVIDYATRYPEAIPLPSIETERVAEALVSIFTRVGIPKEMLTDQGDSIYIRPHEGGEQATIYETLHHNTIPPSL